MGSAWIGIDVYMLPVSGITQLNPQWWGIQVQS